MEEFYLKVYLFKPNRVPPIKIAKDSQLKITIETMDYTIPPGATAAAFANGVTSEKVYTQSCSVSGNKVSFTPVPGFFVQGRNLLQYEIGGGVIPLAIDVNCEISLPTTGETAEPETVRPLVQRAEAAAATAEEKANAAAGSAGAAAGSADAAGKSAADALQSKNAAAGSASAAAGSAASAGQSANAAAGSASAALESKNAAAGSAQEALTSKNAAASSADSAAGSASAAAGSATAAAGSAQEALASQNSAAGSAQAAQEALEKTQEISVNPAYIGDNGNWFIWDITQDSYVDSGVPAQGPKGDPGAVQTVCGVAPDASGNVVLDAGNVGAATKGYVDASVRKAAPRNLLDNSDFRNPVNQRGQSSYSLSAWGGYCIDRWAAFSNGATITIGSGSGGLTLSGSIHQPIASDVIARYNGKVLTLAVKMEGSVYCCSGEVKQIGTLNVSARLDTPYGSIGFETETDNKMFVIIDSSITSSVIEWAALYEGEYTAETLPEYQQKGYGAELAECQRYFYRVTVKPYSRFGYGIGEGSTQHIISFPIPVPMRVYSSILLTGTIFTNPGDISVTSIGLFGAQSGAEANALVSTASAISGFFRLRALEGTAYIDVIADL